MPTKKSNQTTKPNDRAANQSPDAQTAKDVAWAHTQAMVAVQDYEPFYLQYLPLAEALSQDGVKPLKADVGLAHQNILVGVNAVMARKDELAKRLPHDDIESITALPRIAQALIFLQARFETGAGSDTLETDVKEARGLRRALLASATALAENGVLDKGVVAEIRKGQGLRDMAKDCISLADLFNRHPHALGKTSLVKAQIDRAAALGASLSVRLKPARAREGKPLPPNVQRTKDQRDRFWTLIDQKYDYLWSLGALLFGRAVDEHVPPLLGYVASISDARKAKKAQRELDVATTKAKRAVDRAAAKEKAVADAAAKKAARRAKRQQPN